MDRAFTANLLGTLALTIVDRVGIGSARVARHGANAPAALVTLLWYPDRPIAFLADRLRITHPGAVQLVDRLARDGLVDRIPGEDGRTKLLALSDRGERVAHLVLDERRQVLDRAVSALDDAQVVAVDRRARRHARGARRQPPDQRVHVPDLRRARVSRRALPRRARRAGTARTAAERGTAWAPPEPRNPPDPGSSAGTES